MRLAGVDDDLQEILDAEMDEVPARRRAREAFKDIQLGIDHILFKAWLQYCLFIILMLVQLCIFFFLSLFHFSLVDAY